MKIRHTDKIWMVSEPTRQSTTRDILWETTLKGLELQVRGGLRVEDANVRLYTDHTEAEADADHRMTTIALRRSWHPSLRT